jgi:Spy/CpxP family protein refolding chaperone
MKSRFFMLLAVALVAVLLAASVAAESDMKTQPGEPPKKDMCLLVAMNCANETETIQQRIGRLHNEIRKGTDVYTPDELNILNQQLLDETNELHDLEHGGGGGHHSGHGR